MAQPDNTFDRYDLNARGDDVREDLSNILYNVSPTEVPVTTNIGVESTDNTYTEWEQDDIPDPKINAVVDGADFDAEAVTDAVRLGNFCQISRREFTISDRAEVVNKVGRRSEIGYKIALRGKALRRDVESGITSRSAASAGTSSVAGRYATIPTWIRTNDQLGGSGASSVLSGGVSPGTHGYPNTAGTPGTPRGLTEQHILTAGHAVYSQSAGNPNALFLDTQVKQSFSHYLFGTDSSRIATQYQEQGKSPRGGITVVGAVDVYVNDFQVIDIVPSRFIGVGGTSRDVLFLDTSYWDLSFLRPYNTKRIAKSGDSHKRMLLVDYTVRALAEQTSATIAAVQDATAVAAG